MIGGVNYSGHHKLHLTGAYQLQMFICRISSKVCVTLSILCLPLSFVSLGPVWLLSLVKWCRFLIMSPRRCFRLRTFPPHLFYQPGDSRLATAAQRVCGWVSRWLWKMILFGGLKRVFDVMFNCVLVAFCGIRK